MDFKAIIFDLDGTVVDTEQIWDHALKELLTLKGIVLTPEHVQEIERKIMGLAVPYCCQFIKEYFNFAEPADILARQYVDIVRVRYQAGIKLISGFADFHRLITVTHKLKSGIATSADNETVNWTKSHVPLEQFFGQHIYNISHVDNKAKPDPALYLHTAAQLIVEPELCLAIEDSSNGIAAAKAAGMACIGINTSGRRHLLNEADVIVDGYHQINLQQITQKKKI